MVPEPPLPLALEALGLGLLEVDPPEVESPAVFARG